MQAYSPPSRRRGGRDLKKDAAKHPLIGADGVVVSSYRSFIPNDFDNRWLETTTPSAPAKERGHFSYGAATPPSRRRGIRSFPNRFPIWTPLPSRRRGISRFSISPRHYTSLSRRSSSSISACTVYGNTLQIDRGDLAGVGDVLQWIGVENDEVGTFPSFQRAGVR